MKTKNLSLKPLTLALALSPGLVLAEPLNSIVVTANNKEQTLKTITVNMQVITKEDIVKRQYKTLAEALNAIPGLSTYSSGGIGSNTSVYMRGLDGKNILVLLDGVPLNEPMGLSGANFNFLMTDNIERIEIVKGAQSGVWGADAVAGVINIITRKSKSDTQLDTSIEYGSNQYQKITSAISGKNHNLDYFVAINSIRTDGFSSVKPMDGSEYDFEKDGHDQNDLSFRLGFNINDSHRIESNIQNSKAINQYDNDSGGDPNADYLANFNFTQRQVAYLTNTKSFKFRAYLQDIRIQREYESNYSFEADSSVTEFGALASFDYAQNNLQLAINDKQLKNERDKTKSYRNAGFGITNTNILNQNKLILTQALRLDNYNAFEDKVTGKLGLKNWMNGNTFFAANIGTGYRAPTIDEVAYSTIKPESTQSYDLTFGYAGTELTYFNQTTQDKISYVGGYPNSTYENVEGQSTFTGIEFTYRNHLEILNADLGLSFSQLSAKDKDGKYFARRPEQKATVNFDFYGISKSRIGFETRYIGTTYDKADQKGAQIGEYFVTDLSADYQLNKNIALFSKIENLFDEDYSGAIAKYESDGVTPEYVYGNGGTQLFIGLRGQM